MCFLVLYENAASSVAFVGGGGWGYNCDLGFFLILSNKSECTILFSR